MGSQPLKGSVSGSRAAAILGLNPFMTQVEIWQIIMEELSPGFNKSHGYDFTPFDGNASTRWGTAFEDAVIELAENAAGKKILNPEREYFGTWPHRHYITGRGWIENEIRISCHIDGDYEMELEEWYMGEPYTLHEGKTTSEMVFHKKWGKPGTDRVPQEYAIQVQHQMMCTGAEECILSVLVFPKTPQEWENMGWIVKADSCGNYRIYKENPYTPAWPKDWATVNAQQGYFHQYTIQANPAAHNAMKAAYSHFWSNYVIPQREPPCRSYDDVKRLFVEPKGVIIATPEIESLCREYKAITKEIGASGPLGKRKKKLKTVLLDHMRTADPHADNEEREKTGLVSTTGAPLVSFDGKTFR